MNRTTSTLTTGSIPAREPRIAPRSRRRALAATLLAATLLAASATTAAATSTETDPVPTPAATVAVDGDQVTITVDLAAVQRLCDSAPRAEDRLTALLERIEGDADVAGSSEWLRARAASASEAGQGDRADLLTDRAERRAALAPELRAALARVVQARETVCSALPEAS